MDGICRVVLLLCGGNIDTSILGRCLDRGLAIDGRLVKFHATLSDRPGGIAELCRILATIGVCVKDIIHERAWLSDDVFSVRVSLNRTIFFIIIIQNANLFGKCMYKKLIVRHLLITINLGLL